MAGFQQLRVTREVDFTGAALIGVGGGNYPLQGGKAFFVNSSTGDNGYEGTSSAYPLADLETAYGKCTAGKGDYIFVQVFSTLTDAPLTIAKNDIHLISLGTRNFDNGNDLNGDDEVALNLASGGYDFEIAGFNIGADGDHYALESTAGSLYRNHIHHCTFGHNFSASDGIHVLEISHATIDHCLFSNMLTGYGIYVSSVVDSVIADNTFFCVADKKCIYVTGGAVLLSILENKFYSHTDEDEETGWAIDLAAACTSGIVMGNKTSQVGSSSHTPYLDRTGTNMNNIHFGWSDNHNGVTHPASPVFAAE